MKIELRLPVFIGLLLLMLLQVGIIMYQGVTLDIQQHTIREQLGLEVSPDATPRAPKLPAYVPPLGTRLL